MLSIFVSIRISVIQKLMHLFILRVSEVGATGCFIDMILILDNSNYITSNMKFSWKGDHPTQSKFTSMCCLLGKLTTRNNISYF